MRLSRVWQFLGDDHGQDLVEYTLLMAFICLTAAAFFFGVGQNTAAIWSIVNSRLANAVSGGSGS
jgi:Flp pilus assembly pilin Flp